MWTDAPVPFHRFYLQESAWWYDHQWNLTAFNAILTWIKLFKYLDYHPAFSLLVRTLARAAKPLLTFLVSFTIVILGCGQAFFMSFGMEEYRYRNFLQSLFSLLRMAVGEFDYDALAETQPSLGPLLFWLFIVLVNFVLMSMFIALISEAYVAVREEEHNVLVPRLQRLGYGSLAKVTAEAERRVAIGKELGLISARMYKELRPFRAELPEFTARGEQEARRTGEGFLIEYARPSADLHRFLTRRPPPFRHHRGRRACTVDDEESDHRRCRRCQFGA